MITALYAGMPVSDLEASRDWYTRFFGCEPTLRVGDEILWDIGADACLFIEPNPAQAGAGRMTLGAAGLDELLERFATAGIEHEPVETLRERRAAREGAGPGREIAGAGGVARGRVAAHPRWRSGTVDSGCLDGSGRAPPGAWGR